MITCNLFFSSSSLHSHTACFVLTSDEKSLEVKSGVLSDKRVSISSVNKTDLDELRSKIEQGIMASTGRLIKTLVFPPDGPQLRWDKKSHEYMLYSSRWIFTHWLNSQPFKTHGDSHIRRTEMLVKKFETNPDSYQDPVLWVWLEFYAPRKRYLHVF